MSEDEHIERLYTEYADRLLAYCLTHLGSRAEAEDAVQLTFLCAMRALRRGVVPRSESAWLHSIACNVCRGQLRSAARRPKLDDTSPDSLAASDSEGDGELLADLRAALEALPARQRSALLLREWHGFSAPEIARRLRLTTPATHALLTRARRSVALALTASRQAALVLVGLVVSLRAWAKGALSGAAAQTAAATVAVVGVGTTVIATDRAVIGDDPRTDRAAALASIDRAPTLGSTTSASRTSPLSRAGPARRGTGSRNVVRRTQDGTPSAPRVVVPTGAGESHTPVPPVDGSVGSTESSEDAPRAADPAPPRENDASKAPTLDPAEAVPDLEPVVDPILEPLLDPLLGGATDGLPPLEVPAVPPVPQVDVPPVEVPQVPLLPPLPPLP